MREAVRIWRESDHGDQLEGIEQDPVFSLLMTALAYQSNETESFLEQMKSDVLNDFARMLSPYEVGHAIPATAVIETSLQSGLSDLEVNEQHVFTLPDTDARFISLLQTRVLNAAIRSVVRMDGRRWKVTLKFDSPITDLSGFCFAIRNQNFKNLRLYIKGQLLPLVSPWDFSELPLMPCFSIDSILYNRNQTYRAAASCLDLFARQNIRLYYIKKHQGSKYIPSETDSIDLVFEQILTEPFSLGENKTGFIARFQFIFEPKNFQAYLERAKLRNQKKQQAAEMAEKAMQPQQASAGSWLDAYRQDSNWKPNMK